MLKMKCINQSVGKLAMIVALLLMQVGILGFAQEVPPASVAAVPVQTDVNRAEHLVDDKGVPLLKIAGVGEQRQPAGVAIYALAYAGVEVYDSKLTNLKNSEKFDACISWLEQNLKQRKDGLWVWEYNFDNTYNDISIKAPWSSAFAQATGIQAFLLAYKRTGNDKYLTLANKAAQSLFIPLDRGGFLFQSGNDIWFEEIPEPKDNPGHILNGHMRVLLALKELAETSGDATIESWLKRGTDTLYHWMPLYDTGYWLRYDLNPQKKDLLFRFANPYGFANHPLAVDKITLRDPVSKQEIVLDVGTQGDAMGANRIAGTDWGQDEQFSGRTVRKLVSTALENKPDEMAAPHSYFYLSLPGEWKNNLRDQWYEMVVEYYDDVAANVTLQQRSIAPGQTFHDMRDGDLHLTGAGQWRKWIVPLRSADLGYWVGASYADKHRRYLEQISQWDKRFVSWSKMAIGYADFISLNGVKLANEIRPKLLRIPNQTPLADCHIDQNGVQAFRTPDGREVYNIFEIASQAMSGKVSCLIYPRKPVGNVTGSNLVDNEPEERPSHEKIALDWLMTNSETAPGGGLVWRYKFPNAYNDVEIVAPWASAFGQAHVLKSFLHAYYTSGIERYKDYATSATLAYSTPLDLGGFASRLPAGSVFFEEVPKSSPSHILNGHLISIVALFEAVQSLKISKFAELTNAGIKALRDKLYLFDTGYWLRYDQNPKKELLIQIDWADGESSPLIDEVLLQNPQTGHYVRLDVGEVGDASDGTHISGSEWQAEQTVNGKTVRMFKNGYLMHMQTVPGGARHNVYLALQLPDRVFADDFDVPAHRLIIRYKDAAKGRFDIKVQAIHEGNKVTFIPLRDGVWATVGDQLWKEKIFTLRPQDLGWYKGADYQAYEVEQLQRIAKLTDDWFFNQYAERHRFFLEQQKLGRSTIIEPINTAARPSLKLSVSKETPTYPGHSFGNALDGDPDDDYVAGVDNEKEAAVEISVDPASSPTALHITWESLLNFAKIVKVYALSGNGEKEVLIGEVSAKNEPVMYIPLKSTSKVKSVRIVFSEFSGQPRLLLRLLEIQ